VTVDQKKRNTEDILRRFHEEGSFGKAYDGRLLRRLWVYVYPHRSLLYQATVLGLITVVTSLIKPLVIKHVIDEGILLKREDVLFNGALLFAVLVIGEQALQVGRVYSSQLLGARVVSDLRRNVFAFLHTLPMRFFDRQPVGRLVTRVTGDTDTVLELTSSGALNIVTDLVKLLGIVGLMVALDWQLSIVAFLAVPPVAILVREVRKRHREAFREIRAKTARMNATMNEQVSGMPIVQAYGRQEAAAEEFDVINEGYRDANIRSIKYDAMQDAAIETVMAVCLALVLVALGYHPVSFGVLVAFNAYIIEFFGPISALAQRYTIVQSSMAGAERIFALLDVTDTDAQAEGGSANDGDPSLAISFEQVTFAYGEGNPVLQGITFAAKRGEKIALVGPTGSGKTTIASLLLRLYEPGEGVVRVNGRDVRGLARADLRAEFAVVPQDVFLFPGSIADNVAAGETPDLERVAAVLRRLHAEEIIANRPGGLLAPVEERGGNFSAGERQLIAFARALYRDAPILIFDEATASIDSDTEARLQGAVDELLRERTAIVIAHRLSTIQAVDRIVVLHQGRVAEQGTHDELLASGGLYAKLHTLHFSRT
jgi:ATP-binding cassette, subfamily B, multidrug efflux pump